MNVKHRNFGVHSPKNVVFVPSALVSLEPGDTVHMVKGWINQLPK